jgi:uncharacterized protein YrrD
MFTSHTTLMKIPLVTTDGEQHQVCCLLFDDRSWTICSLVVEAGTWFSRRQVVIGSDATDEPDLTKKVIAAKLTHQELVKCADASSVRPVSQQQQLALKKYFGWPESEPKWYLPPALVPAQREFPAQANDDPHLRNTMDLLGYEVWSADRHVGILSDFIMEPNSWHIKYLSVKVGDWVYHEERFVPTLTVQSISWGKHRVTLNDRSFVASHTLPPGQNSLVEARERCSIHGKGMTAK